MNIDELEDFREDNKNNLNKIKEEHKAFLFQNILTDKQLLLNIKSAQFENPSPVQSIAIPKALLGKDILCQAKSGTGKTAVFVFSILQMFKDRGNNGLEYLVIVHADEIIDQVKAEFLRFSKEFQIIISSSHDIHYTLNPSTNIFITTIEVAKSLIMRNCLDINHLRCIVVDECDLVVSNHDLSNILNCRSAQKMMFTATLTKTTKKACLNFLNDPFNIFVDDDSKLTLHGLKQYYIETREKDKIEWLFKISKIHKQIIVFSKYIQNALYIEKMLERARAVIDKMDISERTRIISYFKSKEFSILSTTDILSRGIDIQDVECVVNYDMPDDPQTYLHRVGRAGRFESSGFAYNFVNGPTDGIRLNEIMNRYEIDIEKSNL